MYNVSRPEICSVSRPEMCDASRLEMYNVFRDIFCTVYFVRIEMHNISTLELYTVYRLQIYTVSRLEMYNVFTLKEDLSSATAPHPRHHSSSARDGRAPATPFLRAQPLPPGSAVYGDPPRSKVRALP